MAAKTLTSVVTGVLNDVRFGLEGREIGLSFDGNETRKSTNRIEVDGLLGVFLRVVGIKGSSWKLEITADGAEKPFMTRSGILGEKGFHELLEAVECP